MFKQLIGIAALALSFTAAAQQPHGGGPAHAPWHYPAHAGDHPARAKATVIPLAGGHGGLQYFQNGSFKMGGKAISSSGRGNCLPTRG